MQDATNNCQANNVRSAKFRIIHEIRKENKEQLFLQALESTATGYVIYISPEEITDIPALPSVSRHYLKLLTFLYPKTFDAFVEGLATLPEWQNVPSTIIVDGLNEYCATKTMQNACGSVALLLDTAMSCSRVLESPCQVIVSVTKGSQSAEFCNLIRELYSQFYCE